MRPFYSPEILLIPRWSRLEYDSHTKRIPPAHLIKQYHQNGADTLSILAEHQSNHATIESFLKRFDARMIISRNELTPDVVREKEILISIGGDNHFQYVSHFADNQIMVGVNSDPARSEGFLTFFTEKDMDYLEECLRTNAFSIEKWSRIQATLNGKKVWPLATSELFLGEEARPIMSKHILKWKNKTECQKGSGLIVSTPTGINGWYRSAKWYVEKQPLPLKREANAFSFVLSEPHVGKLSSMFMLQGTVGKGDSLHVVSRNDTHGILAIDSWNVLPFPEGSMVALKTGKNLRVLKGQPSE